MHNNLLIWYFTRENVYIINKLKYVHDYEKIMHGHFFKKRYDKNIE